MLHGERATPVGAVLRCSTVAPGPLELHDRAGRDRCCAHHVVERDHDPAPGGDVERDRQRRAVGREHGELSGDARIGQVGDDDLGTSVVALEHRTGAVERAAELAAERHVRRRRDVGPSEDRRDRRRLIEADDECGREPEQHRQRDDEPTRDHRSPPSSPPRCSSPPSSIVIVIGRAAHRDAPGRAGRGRAVDRSADRPEATGAADRGC